MFENCTIKYVKDFKGNNSGIKIKYPIDLDKDGNERTDKRHNEITAPIDEQNTDYQNILKWVADGNTIEEAD